MMLLVFAVLGLGLVYFAFKALRSQAALRELSDVQKTDNKLQDIEKIIRDAKEEQRRLMVQRAAQNESTPGSWGPQPANGVLVEVPPEESQYWDVHDKFVDTMDGEAWLSKVWRVQNTELFNFYGFHKNRLNTAAANGHMERSVWHGTSGLDPSMIYNDHESGFMMQFCSGGFWGRGIYFADLSAYSYSYSFKPGSDSMPADAVAERGRGQYEGEREMFLAKLVSDYLWVPCVRRILWVVVSD